MNKGKIVVIDGLDGSGKATQSEILYNTLKEAGENVHLVSFPNYESPACGAVKMYLGGQLGDKSQDIGPYAASLFYTVDRIASYLSEWKALYESGTTIIADRYTTSNILYQCSKLPEYQWEGFSNWLSYTEYNLSGLPSPDKVIFLDVSPEVSHALMAKRYNGDESKKDLHEKDIKNAIRAREVAIAFIQRGRGIWHRVECDNGTEMRTIETIAKDILTVYRK